MEPTAPDSPIAQFIDKHGEGIHHFTLRVTDIQQHIRQLKENNIPIIYDPAVNGTEGTLITFVRPKSTHGVLIELSQEME